ncbi:MULTISPECIES: PucR family transcriptional regulator [Actinomadura]|uniref:PucR family transcriptional regulator n=1 Tax=Actinomadura yumaensis TaxID=111807 RepID=A0ABW2D0S8_9ACTN|nr:PucR family transcriptional regulator [Actinomadura sp. J1-007]
MPADLLAAPGVPARLTALAGPLTGRPVGGARLVEDPTSLSALPDGSLAILTGPASERATGYRLDVALRDLTAVGGSALVLTSRTVPPVPLTARLIAERGGLALLHAAADPPVLPGPLDLAALAGAFTRVIGRDAEDALVRLSAAIDALLNAGDTTHGAHSTQGLDAAKGGGGVEGADGDARRVLAAVTAALGVPLRAGRAGPGEIGAVAHGHGGEVAVAAPRSGGHLDRAVALAVRLAARAIARADDTGDSPVRSRSLLLSELLIAPEGQALRLLSRARALGLPVDGWHIVLRVEPAALHGADRYDLLDAADRAALRVLRTTGGHWNSARADDALLLIRSQPGDPGLRAAVETTERLLAGLRDRFPGADLRCGVGGAHQGPLGLRASAREARTALARGGPRGGRPVTVHDLAGLDRMLGEWYASEAARASAEELLAPITGLGPDRARPLLRTLQAYLDHQGSPARAAEELHLHRNAVSDRIRRASTLLAVDLNDPEQRLALQLACRALHH